MKLGKVITNDDEIKALLESSRTIAVVGLSPEPARDSHRIASYLSTQGYRIVPVRPGEKEILGEKAYRSLDDIQDPIDIVDVFRRPEQVTAHAREALGLKPRAFWMQLGIENEEAAALLIEAGIDVIMNRCIKVEHQRLLNAHDV